MTINANVKGYINWSEWGIVETVVLKSYEEIVAMATSEWSPRTNTISELNLYAEEYYNKFDEEWHLTTRSWMGGVIDWIWNNFNHIIYWSSSYTWIHRTT